MKVNSVWLFLWKHRKKKHTTAHRTNQRTNEIHNNETNNKKKINRVNGKHCHRNKNNIVSEWKVFEWKKKKRILIGKKMVALSVYVSVSLGLRESILNYNAVIWPFNKISEHLWVVPNVLFYIGFFYVVSKQFFFSTLHCHSCDLLSNNRFLIRSNRKKNTYTQSNLSQNHCVLNCIKNYSIFVFAVVIATEWIRDRNKQQKKKLMRKNVNYKSRDRKSTKNVCVHKTRTSDTKLRSILLILNKIQID